MRKILIYIILSFIFSNISFAKKSGCTDGDCNNGFGTWTYTDKTTYVGDWVNGSKKGKGIETWPNGYVYEGEFNDSKWHGIGKLNSPMAPLMKESGKIVKCMAKEFLPGLMAK